MGISSPIYPSRHQTKRPTRRLGQVVIGGQFGLAPMGPSRLNGSLEVLDRAHNAPYLIVISSKVVSFLILGLRLSPCGSRHTTPGRRKKVPQCHKDTESRSATLGSTNKYLT